MPGCGPSLNGDQWITTKHPTQKNRRTPYLLNHKALGKAFRMEFLAGLRRLFANGKLKLNGTVSWLQDELLREAWLKKLKEVNWNVFIEGPPHGKSDPLHVIKYLARYMSGGPIANSRLISHEDGMVIFWARTKDKANKSKPFPLLGEEFVRRWSMHILPKGYTRSRSYGGYHGASKTTYLQRCRELLDIQEAEEGMAAQTDTLEGPEQRLPECPQCKVEMQLIESATKPAWRDIFTIAVYREPIYCPTLHSWRHRFPEAHPIEGYD